MERRNIAVPRAHGGEAVARILHDGLGVPHSTAKGLIDAGCVTINGRPARSHGQRCEGGDVVEVRFDPERRYEPRPTPRHGPGFRVVHEDLEIVVVDKMPGVLSSPAPGRRDESLAELIAESLRSRGIKKPQLFVVHRLDQHTSGLLAFARTPRAMEWMAAQFESREAGRAYTAVVSGRVARERGTIQSWLVEDAKSLSVRTTPTRGAGKRAITHFAVQERFEDATLVRVGLETGRKHQIRVHFAEIGHPVLGDRRYGEPSPLIARVALHADRLTFRHPKTLEKMTFEAPWPEDLTKLVARLRRGSAHVESDEAADEAPETSAGRTRVAAGPMGRGPAAGAARVAVFPQGLTLTDPMGPIASHLMDPIVPRGEGAAPAGGRPGHAPGGRTVAARAAGPRGPAGRGDRPPREARPAPESFARRERLLRERAVGNRPPQRRAPAGSGPAPRPESEPRWSGERENARPGNGKPGDAKPWTGKREDFKPGNGTPREAKPWSDKSRDFKPGGGKPHEAKSWTGKREDFKRGGEKPRGAKPWSDKSRDFKPGGAMPRDAKPWRGKREDFKPGGAMPRDAKAWSGKGRAFEPAGARARDAKPWRAKKEDFKAGGERPRNAKPWSGKRQDTAKPWSGKPRDAKPWSGRREGFEPVSGKPREAKPWSAGSRASKPWDKKPRDAKPWSGKASYRGSPAGKAAAPHAPAAGSGQAPRRANGTGEARRPWEFREKGSTLQRERRRKIAASLPKGQGKGKKR